MILVVWPHENSLDLFIRCTCLMVLFETCNCQNDGGGGGGGGAVINRHENAISNERLACTFETCRDWAGSFYIELTLSLVNISSKRNFESPDRQEASKFTNYLNIDRNIMKCQVRQAGYRCFLTL